MGRLHPDAEQNSLTKGDGGTEKARGAPGTELYHTGRVNCLSRVLGVYGVYVTARLSPVFADSHRRGVQGPG